MSKSHTTRPMITCRCILEVEVKSIVFIKQWKADTGDGNNCDENNFGLSPAQLKAVGFKILFN